MSSLLTFEETDLCPGRLDLSPRRNRLRNWLLGVVALLAVLLAGLAFVILNWPFTRVLVEKDLSLPNDQQRRTVLGGFMAIPDERGRIDDKMESDDSTRQEYE